ncbi:holo-ACP synthase [candidate division TA06 bacterium]|nr:holo-ACP synthase [candidate division TA06 bacterium]
MTSVGVDLVEIPRIRETIERWDGRFLKRVFTPREIEFCEGRRNKYQSYAARFAAKEAILKAIGTGMYGGVRWKDMEILDDERSQPQVFLEGLVKELVGRRKVLLSLSHTGSSALAFVLLLEDSDSGH